MALCGKNLSLDAVTDKIAEIESKITEKIDAVASDLKAELDAKLPELEKELDNLLSIVYVSQSRTSNKRYEI